MGHHHTVRRRPPARRGQRPGGRRLRFRRARRHRLRHPATGCAARTPPDDAPGTLPPDNLAATLVADSGGLTLLRARGLVRELGRAYDLVLVTAPAGLLVPLGDGWTLADLAAAVQAPAIVVTGPGPAAINHATLALGALTGQGVPASVVHRHDGVSTGFGFLLPPHHVLASIEEIHRDWRTRCDVISDLGAPVDGSWWHRQLVPSGWDGSGGTLVVDQRPGGAGRVGSADPETGTGFDGWPPSLADHLERTATALETGRPFGGHHRPRVTPEGLLEWDAG